MMRPLMYRGKNLLLYADDAIVVVYKPAGLAVQTKKMGEKDLESLLRTWQAGQGAGTYIGVVHRLDQPVEGVMVLARTKEAAAALSAQAAGTDMQKTYVAVTRGVLPKVEGQLTDFLLRDGKTERRRERRKLRWITGYCRYRQRKRNSLWWKSICIPAATIRSGYSLPTRERPLWGIINTAVCRMRYRKRGMAVSVHHLKLSRMRQKI